MPVHSASWRGIRRSSPLRTQATISMAPAITAIPTSSPIVPGGLPSCRPASVSVPYATNSPDGTKITRVTAKTSTSASASSA